MSGSGSLVVEFFSEPDPNQPGNYNILDTDYDSYTIVYDCNERSARGVNYAYETFGILARDYKIADEKLAEVKEIALSKIPYYNWDLWVAKTRQGDDCEY